MTIAPEAPPATTPPKPRSDYSELSRRIRAAGLLQARPGRQAARIAINAVLLLSGWTTFVLLGDSWYQLLVAGFLAVMSAQLGFVGHEIGHRQVFRTRRASTIAGLLHGNLAIGLGIGWWTDKHNRHHSHPNHVGQDPDVGEGALAWTARQAHARHGLGRWWARQQGKLFFPLLLLAGLELHRASLAALPRLPPRRRFLDASLLLIHFIGYFTALFLVLSPEKALVFFLVHKLLFGLYLGMSFAPNHKGMPVIQEDEKLDFVRRQVLTSRNIRGGPVTDLALGGLNYQIEHHLFPNMPRENLRRAKPIVEEFCAEYAIPYYETSLVNSYRQTVRYLDSVGNAGTEPRLADQR